jgi:hypothetical protein
MLVLNRSAIVVKPKQPFLDWLHTADPSSLDLSLLDLVREPIIYLIPECDKDDDVAEILHELCEEIFEEQLAGWYADTDCEVRGNPEMDAYAMLKRTVQQAYTA